MELNYQKDLEIDLNNLHGEWLKQPVLYSQYAEAAAEASRQKDDTRNKLEVIRAQLDLEIRSNPGKFELGKVTEAAVANVVLLQREYQEALGKYYQAKYELEILNGVVKAFDQKKTALENEVRLWAGQYFAGPKEPRDIGKGFKEGIREQTSAKHRERLNRDKIDKMEN